MSATESEENKFEENMLSNKSLNNVEKKREFIKRKSSESEFESDNHFDYNLQFDKELEDKPDILAFIIKLQEIIKKQSKKISKLKSKLKHYKKIKRKNVSTQVENTSIDSIIEKSKSITEEITEAAESALQQTGFVYEATSGMYYDYNTGYYYNAELGLYYDGNSGTYLTYNRETHQYEYHSQVDTMPTVKPAQIECKNKRKQHHKEQDGGNRMKKRKENEHDDNNLEEGECSSSDNETNSLNNNDKIDDIERDLSDESELELGNSWPPCMRVIIKETTIKKLKTGSLHIITCDGGKIGREGDVSILIPDINVSKVHAELIFDRELNKYTLTDLGSQNGTILNGVRVSQAKQKSEPVDVVHGSIIQIGTTKLLCHIHDGQKTCGHCEPGLIQTDDIKTDEKSISINTLHKKELKRLKKKFGLETQDISADLAPGYTDRAEERRKTVGSQNDKEKTEVASLDQSIVKENKGFKMLSKMGWTQGQSLGKDGTGLTEPVPLISNPGTAGLGSRSMIKEVNSRNIDVVSQRKTSVWKKTQQRYNRVQDANLDIFKDSSSDEEANT